MMSTKTRLVTAGCAVAALIVGPSAAWAQSRDADAEVIVTATKRASTIQEVPFSINAQTAQDIQKAGATNIEELARNVAGLNVQNLGPGQSQVAVRGVSAGQIVRDQPGVKEQVGVYLDESVISLSLFTPDLDLFDLNRVETLRGPQGTLFGSGSVGGTIRYITNQPSLEQGFGGQVEANVNALTDGEVGGHLKGAVNIPIGEQAALRVVGYHTEYAGFIDARREGGRIEEDVNGGQRSGGRIALRVEPASYIAITPRLIYQTVETDGFNRQERFNLFANPFTTTRPAVTFGDREQFLLLNEEFTDETIIGDLTVELSLENVDITSISSYTQRDILVSRDASALTGSVSVDLGYPDAAVLLPSNLRDTTDVEQVTQEIRAASTGDGRFQWLVGAFYGKTDREYSQRLPTPGYDAFTDATLGAGTSAAVANGFGADSPFNSDLPYELTQTALFGEASLDITDRLTATAGGRFYDFDENRTITTGGLFAAGDSGTRDETSSSGFTPRFLLSYDVNDGLTLNAQAAQGFRLGGVNDPLNTALCNAQDLVVFGGFQSYEDETLWNYEVGAKATGNGFTANGAVFYSDISDLQVTLDAGSCSSRISFNVPEAHAQGVEAEITFAPTAAWDFGLSASVVEAEFDSTVRDSTGAVLGGVQSGNRLASVPEYQVSANATYNFPLAFISQDTDGFVTVSAQSIGARYTQPSDQRPGAGTFVSGLPFGGATGTDATNLDLELDAYTIVNVSGGFYAGPWEMVAYVNNVADENANLAFDRERGGRARLAFHTNAPRTFGLTARRSF